MTMFTALWTAGFFGWDVAHSVSSAKEGNWPDAALMAGMALVTVALGVIAYRYQRLAR